MNPFRMDPPDSKRRRSSADPPPPNAALDHRRWSILSAPTPKAQPPPVTPGLSLGRLLACAPPTPASVAPTAQNNFRAAPSTRANDDEIEEFEDEDPIDDAPNPPPPPPPPQSRTSAFTPTQLPPPPPQTPSGAACSSALVVAGVPPPSAPRTAASTTSAAGSSSAYHPPRASLVSNLSLNMRQLGEAAGARAGRRESTRKQLGAIGALAQRAVSERDAAEQLLLVKHRILGPMPPQAEAVQKAMKDPELRHMVLHCVRVLAMAPLVVCECVEEKELLKEEERRLAAADAAAVRNEGDEGEEEDEEPPPPSLRVVLHKARYERVIGAGGKRRFVIFAPWYEQGDARDGDDGAGRMLLAPMAEALP